ncbi:16S rRNA (cytosine(1402)-N(4))-methyltransferase RsmH [Desulfovibrio sp. OttesenSCG-928-G15]|nr:16S rRNA (cytosine(1402)-N(4))-methyltransferase RsmH [Desulfovibrio sp. OttesenSCG-928-G15]
MAGKKSGRSGKKHSSGRTNPARSYAAQSATPLPDEAPASNGSESPDAAPPSPGHISVLLGEVLEFFTPRPGMRVLDATLGLGGHSEAMLQKAFLAGYTDCELLGIDRDASALSKARKRLEPFGENARFAHRPFSEAALALEDIGWKELDFVLADIGVSSMQLDKAERGFSFRHDGPLDMRMDESRGKNAEDLVNDAPVLKLRDIIRDYGEEPMAARIARAIDDARCARRIETTLELAKIVEQAYPAKWRATSRNHPATRTFQALRMAVNDELGELEKFLHSLVPLMRKGGKIAVISFHSLEDRMVKHFYRDEATGCRCPRQVPVCICGHQATLKVLTRKPVLPSEEEAAHNLRARSAKLRVAQRIDSNG